MLYLALMRTSFRRMTAYRGATLAGVVTNLFFGLLRAWVFTAVFAASGAAEIGGFTRQDAITYTALTQALIGPLYVWGWWEVARLVRTGDIVGHLARPYDFYTYWLSRDLGRAAFQLAFRGAPMLVVFPLLFDLTWPDGPAAWAAVFSSTLLAVLVSFAWRFLVNMAALWFTDPLGVARLAYIVMTFLSGFIVPVAWFPDWLRLLVALTPMPSMVNTPIEVYLGHYDGAALFAALGVQLMWFVVLAFMCRVAFRRGHGRLVVQGG